MNDKTIINIISKTYFSIVSFFIFIFLLLLLTFIVLQNGIFIKKIHISNIEVRELYIKWNKKINLSVKEITISKSKTKQNAIVDYKTISKYLKYTYYIKQWFNSIVIEKINLNQTTAFLKYIKNRDNIFIVKSNDIDIDTSIIFKNNTISLNINKLYDKKRDISVNGNIYFNVKDSNIYTNIDIKIANDASFSLYSKVDFDKFTYKIYSNKDIKNITHIINILNLPKHLRWWTYDAIKMSSIKIKNISGYINFKDFSNAYKDIKINSVVGNLKYKYNKKLDPIVSSQTKIDFINGVLYIKPQNAYTCGMFLDKSHLKIDFTKQEELLTLNLLFNGIVNSDILNILHTYKIKLPFIQNSGKTQTDLTLILGLQTLDTQAYGDFFTKSSNIDYMGVNLNITDAYIHINNNDINIQKMKVNYKDIAKADIVAKYNAKNNKGKVFISLNSVEVNDLNLSKPINVLYNINPKDDLIDINNSTWKFKSNNIYINKISMPFNLKTLKLNIPDTFVELNDMGSAYISGSIDLNNTLMMLDANILNFSYDGVSLSQPNTRLKIKYDKKLSIKSTDEIFFTIVGTQYRADRILLTIDKNDIYLKHTMLNIGKYISTKLYINYNSKTKLSHISLNNFILIDPNTKKLLYKNKKILLSAHIKDSTITIDSKELRAEFLSKESGWKLHLNSINKISRNSDLLESLHINSGIFTMYRNKKDKFTRFKSKIVYPYKILVKNNIPTDKYSIKGKIYKENIDMMINNSIDVKIKNSISIDAKNTSININELLKAIKETNTTNRSKNPLKLTANLKDSYLYVNKNRKIIYDSIHLEYIDKTLKAKLNYKKAQANLELKNKKLNLYGQNFDDTFMNKLFTISKFGGGALDFFANGNIDDYNGVFYIKQTTLKDYKVLNNILAFVNTIPSLVTFSLPGYSKSGLYVKQSYVNFHYKNKKFHVSDIYLDSKEVDILGKGIVDMKNDNLDLVLNLKTDLGSDLSKIPIVGYILFNGDSISTTLSIKGKISNPKVKSLIAKEIMVAPFNIIKRTLLLPYELFK